jgi:hypothetical protein
VTVNSHPDFFHDYDPGNPDVGRRIPPLLQKMMRCR